MQDFFVCNRAWVESEQSSHRISCILQEFGEIYTVKTLHVSRAVYRNAQKGQPKALSLSQGGFELPVIKQGI